MSSSPKPGTERKKLPQLSDAALRAAKPQAKAYKLWERRGSGRGLHLLVTPQGGKLWRLKYRFAGKEKLLALGRYPDVSLAMARTRRDEARRLVATGIDPAAQRRAEKRATADNFKALAEEWLAKFGPAKAEITVRKTRERLERHVFPYIGSTAVRAVDAAALLPVVQRIEGNGLTETAHRVLRYCGQILRYAVSTGRADRDPSRDLRGSLKPVQVEHRAAVTEPKVLGALLRSMDDYSGSNVIVHAAMRLVPLLFVRPGELRKAEWTEIDLDSAQWTVPAWRMKMRHSLTVPLSRQAVSILRELEPITGGEGKKFVFTGPGGTKPLSDAAVLTALRRAGIEKEVTTGHGFRATARTLLDEVLRYRVDLIEHQLGHAVKDPNGRAYNRTSYLQERVEMMQVWADYLDALKDETASKFLKARVAARQTT